MPISQREYQKHPAAYWVGKRVRADRPIHTKGGMVMGIGATGTISRKFGGFSVHVDECTHCHLSFYVRDASPSELTLVPESDPPKEH